MGDFVPRTPRDRRRSFRHVEPPGLSLILCRVVRAPIRPHFSYYESLELAPVYAKCGGVIMSPCQASTVRLAEHAPAVWESIHLRFTQLYRDQGKTLRDVRQILIVERKFHATLCRALTSELISG